MRLGWLVCRVLDSRAVRLGTLCWGEVHLSLPLLVDSMGWPLVAGPRVLSTEMLCVPDTLQPGIKGCAMISHACNPQGSWRQEPQSGRHYRLGSPGPLQAEGWACHVGGWQPVWAAAAARDPKHARWHARTELDLPGQPAATPGFRHSQLLCRSQTLGDPGKLAGEAGLVAGAAQGSQTGPAGRRPAGAADSIDDEHGSSLHVTAGWWCQGWRRGLW